MECRDCGNSKVRVENNLPDKGWFKESVLKIFTYAQVIIFVWWQMERRNILVDGLYAWRGGQLVKIFTRVATREPC